MANDLVKVIFIAKVCLVLMAEQNVKDRIDIVHSKDGQYQIPIFMPTARAGIFVLAQCLDYGLPYPINTKKSPFLEKKFFMDFFIDYQQYKFKQNCMKIRSTFFKREFDLQKAEIIGKGTFAQVYRIFNQDINDSLAIRRVKKSEGDLDDIQKQKLINQQLRKVESDNILKIYDIIEHPQTVWYITEYCSGGSLWDALNLCKDNKMNQKDCLECVLQISKGVQQLHNHRITHRDLKPENILLKTKYVPGKHLPIIKLADFGLSTQKIIMETIAGTKQYIAPEQAKFHNYTNAVDVWSLGIILDEILHGTPFYSGQDNKQVFNKILKTPFKVRDENLRDSIKDLLICLLKKKPYERPIIAVIRSTIQRILQQITNEINGEPYGTKNRKSSIQNPPISNEIKRSLIEQKNRIISMPATKQPGNLVQIFLMHEPKKIQKPVLSKDISPRNRRPVPQKQKEEVLHKSVSALQFKKQIPRSLVQSDTKSSAEKQKEIAVKNASKLIKAQQKEQSKVPLHNNNNKKVQPGIKTSPSSHVTSLNNNEKITLMKNEKRKLIGSHIRKEEYKAEVVNINKYIQNVHSHFKKVSQVHIRVEKQHDFLPNAYFNHQTFSEITISTQSFKKIKKQFDFINYFSTSEDYEIRLVKGQKQLKLSKDSCISEVCCVRDQLRDVFLDQLDFFIDQYIEKVLK